MAETGGTAGGDAGLTAGGDAGGTAGGTGPTIVQRLDVAATARERVELTGTFRG